MRSEQHVVLEVRKLRVEFDALRGRVVCPVREISFRVHRGQRLGIVGESGSGKSLTALSLMRLVPKTARIRGEVFLNRRDLLRLTEREMARVRGAEISMVYQNPLSSLNPVQTVGRQIVEAIRCHERVGRRAARARATELLVEVGVRDAHRRVDSYPHEFSGGMRQRVMIAMALSTNPDLLIADEPTTALDVTTQARIIELLRRLVEERGTSVVLISHDLAVAAEFCSDVQVMHAGRVVERTAAEQLYTHPTHPYSEALLKSSCSMSTDIARPLPAIPGQAPTPEALPGGCAFHPRCFAAIEKCKSIDPVPESYIGPHNVLVECHRASERFRPVGFKRGDV